MTDEQIEAVRKWCEINIQMILSRSEIENLLESAEHLAWCSDMDKAPHDKPIIVFAPGREGLPDLMSFCQWHPDAGFCIDEIREVTHWCLPPSPPGGEL